MRIRMLVTAVIAVVWIGSVYTLQRRHTDRSFLEQGGRVDVTNGTFVLREDFLGIYLNETKIGHSEFRLTEAGESTAKSAGGKVYLFQSQSTMRIDALGIPFNLKTVSEGAVDQNLALHDFSFHFAASGQSISCVGKVEGNVLMVTTKSEGASHSKEYPLQGPIFSPDIVHLVVAREGIEVGKQMTVPIYDPLTTSLDQVDVLVKEQTEMEWEGENHTVYHIRLSYKGFQEDAWIDAGGVVFREQSSVAGIGFLCKRETEEQAREIPVASGTGPDLISASRIPVDYVIEDPRNMEEMRIAVTGCTPADLFPDLERQILESDRDAEELVVIVRKPDYDALIGRFDSPEIAYSGSKDYRECLEPDPFVQSNDSRIVQKAKEITMNAGSRWNAVKQLTTWLHESLRKEIRVTIPSAVEVLESGKGDCNEHSTLFAALARSLGIPTKICAGIVYQDGAFYYHAWNEVLLGNDNPVWLPIDSTFGQTEVDATHIKLNEGALDKQVELIKLIGKMQVKILEAR
ncbi:MAG TPA: transglutaminase-like domain-containing protein [bacterium]|nr:transglutaminase-like domain-containing protein [bacterium]HQL63741.1 transglutaminase-like domain-containing protein [bacterium]